MSEDLDKRKQEAFQIIANWIRKSNLVDKIALPVEGANPFRLSDSIKFRNPEHYLNSSPSEINFFVANHPTKTESIATLRKKAQDTKNLLDSSGSRIVSEVKVADGYSFPTIALTVDINQDGFAEELAKLASSAEHNATSEAEKVSNQGKGK